MKKGICYFILGCLLVGLLSACAPTEEHSKASQSPSSMETNSPSSSSSTSSSSEMSEGKPIASSEVSETPTKSSEPASSSLDEAVSKENATENMPAESSEFFLPYDPWGVKIVELTWEQVQAIPAGSTYRDILKQLGSTRDINNSLYSSTTLCYRVENSLLILYTEDLDAVWPKAGKLTKEDLIPTKDSKKLDPNQYYAIILDAKLEKESGLLVYFMAYAPDTPQFNTISVSVESNTPIQYEDGTKANPHDLVLGRRIRMKLQPEIAESFPPQARAVSITVLKD